MTRIVPALAHTHPGFFRKTLAFIFLHIGLALDEIRPGSNEPPRTGAWVGVQEILPIQAWGFFHLSCAVLIVVGLYRSFQWARYGFISTLLVCGGMAGAFSYGATKPGASFLGAFFMIFVSFLAVSALFEPEAVIPVDDSVRKLAAEVGRG